MLIILRLIITGYIGLHLISAVIGLFTELGPDQTLLVIGFAVAFAIGCEFLFGHISAQRMMKRLSNLPPLGQLLPELEKVQDRMTKWEHDFYLDMVEKNRKIPKFLSEKATMKQINIIFQIYGERVRKVKLKGLTYSLEMTDDETGEIRQITNVDRSDKKK